MSVNYNAFTSWLCNMWKNKQKPRIYPKKSVYFNFGLSNPMMLSMENYTPEQSVYHMGNYNVTLLYISYCQFKEWMFCPLLYGNTKAPKKSVYLKLWNVESIMLSMENYTPEQRVYIIGNYKVTLLYNSYCLFIRNKCFTLRYKEKMIWIFFL